MSDCTIADFRENQWVSVNLDSGRMLARVSKVGRKWVTVVFPYAKESPFSADYLPNQIDLTIRCQINVTVCHGYDLADCAKNYLIEMGHPLDRYLDGVSERMAQRMMQKNGVDKFGNRIH